MVGRGLHWLIRVVEAVARGLPWSRSRAVPEHQRTGRRGEDDAYFWLRQQNYVFVARNWRSPRHHSEIDLIAWEGDILCFVEVKSRRRRGLITAEAAVDKQKQEDLQAVAHDYLRRFDSPPVHRFDVVSVYYEPGRRHPEITLRRNAF